MSEHPAAALPVAGDHAILSRRYVGALYALAAKENAVDTVLADMANLRQLWSDSAEWRFVASDPRLNADMVGKAAAQVSGIVGVCKLTSNFLSVVAQNRRLSLLPLLIENFFEEVSMHRGEVRADVRTARALTDAQRETLLSSLSVVTGGKIRLSVVEDASLLGGLTVKMGSQFIDASVKTKLDHLERTLKAGAAA